MKPNASFFIVHCSFFIAFLSACVSVSDARPLSVQEAGRIVIDATSTAQVMATQNAAATAQRKVTEQALEHMMTTTAHAVGVESAKTREQWTQQAISGTQTAQPRIATATATAQIAKDANEQKKADIEMEGIKQNGDTVRSIVVAIAMFAVASIISFGIVAIIYWNIYLNKKHEVAREAVQSQEYIRSLEARARSTKDTNAGTITTDNTGRLVIIRPDGGALIFDETDSGVNVVALPPALPQPSHVARTPEELHRIINDDTEIVTDTIVIHEPNQTRAIPRFTEDEKRAAQRMLEFLRLAMFAHHATGQSGRAATRIPGFREIGFNSAEEWTSRADLFGEAITRKRGNHGGTFVAPPFASIGELADAVRRGEVRPRLPNKAEQIIEQ